MVGVLAVFLSSIDEHFTILIVIIAQGCMEQTKRDLWGGAFYLALVFWHLKLNTFAFTVTLGSEQYAMQEKKFFWLLAL